MYRYYGIEYMKNYLHIFKVNHQKVNPANMKPIIRNTNLHKRCYQTVRKFKRYLSIYEDDEKWKEYLKTREGILEMMIYCIYWDYKGLLDIVRLNKYHYSKKHLNLTSRNDEYYIEKREYYTVCVAYNPLNNKKYDVFFL